MRIVCGPDRGAERDSRRIRELGLPPSLRRVGRYALAGCRSLETLRLHDNVSDWGDGVLTGCRALDEIEISWGRGGDHGAMAYLAGELDQELDITVLRDGTPLYRLIFPGYREIYEENGPAHHFDYTIEGHGYAYHHGFRQRRFDPIGYDRLWPKIRDAEGPTALRLAWRRLALPEGLTDDARDAYLTYVRAHAGEAVRWLTEERDSEGVSRLLEIADPDRAALRAASSMARERGDTGLVVLLMAAVRRCGPERDRFAL